MLAEQSAKEVILHDRDDLRLIYDRIRFEKAIHNNPAQANRQRTILRSRMRRLSGDFAALRVQAAGSARLTPRQLLLLELLQRHGYKPSDTLLRKLGANVRAQRGLRERFLEGLKKSGLYMDEMGAIFENHNLPKELILLPHIESSFDYHAYSKVGAAGIWQFMRYTGRAYGLKINRYVDERRDPLKATDAAARYLKDSYNELGNWPLAVTSYNHGTQGMARAKRQHGDDLVKIIQKYESRSFQFASKNFYAEFLAAVEIVRNYHQYFGEIDIAEPLEFHTVSLSKTLRLRDLLRSNNLKEEVLRRYNPHLTRHVWKRYRRIPRGVELRLPTKVTADSIERAQAKDVDAATSLIRYRIRRGDTLSTIAQRFGTSIRELHRLNGIRNSHRIVAGRVLVISGEAAPAERYRVRHGDNLTVIARRFNTTVAELRSLNRLRGSRIYSGQILLLPEEG